MLGFRTGFNKCGIRVGSLISPNVYGIRSGIRYSSDGSYKSPDSTIETNEILTENDPWSPTLYTDPVKIDKPGHMRPVTLPEKYRLSYSPIYEAPGSKYVSLLKRLTISFGVLGLYGARLLYDSPHFDDIYAATALVGSITPVVVVQAKTKDYVTRIFRLYNKDKPQTLENLISDENLIMEKLNFVGGRTYNQMVTITGNKSLKLAPEARIPVLGTYSSWVDKDTDTNISTKYYVADDIGGMKMDRIWGIIERNSGIDNGRYIDHKATQDPEEGRNY